MATRTPKTGEVWKEYGMKRHLRILAVDGQMVAVQTVIQPKTGRKFFVFAPRSRKAVCRMDRFNGPDDMRDFSFVQDA